MRTAKTSRLGGCPGCSESSLGAHSFCWFCHVAAHPTLSWKTTTVICIWKFYSNCLALILVNLKIISRVDMSIGIKHDFLSINICCAPRVPADVAPRDPADVNASEKPVWSLLLHNNVLKLEYFGEFASKRFIFFSVPIMHDTCKRVLVKILSRGRLTSSWRQEITFAPVHITGDDVRFCDDLGNAYTSNRKAVY